MQGEIIATAGGRDEAGNDPIDVKVGDGPVRKWSGTEVKIDSVGV
jgi:co-chaperonin GroES (HSP10)